jgi:AraC family transcriptional regulator
MPSSPERPITFHTLHDGPLVAVRDYRCHSRRGGPEAEEHSRGDHIVLMRHGAFCRHFGRRSVTADVNQAVFFARGSSYRVSHPADCGDRGTVFVPAPGVLQDLLQELDPDSAGRDGSAFPFATGPCEAHVFRRHRALVQRLEARDVDPLWVEVTALELVADVLRAAFTRHRLPRRPRRTATHADHAERAEAARAFLSSHLTERITLPDIARAAHASPFHLARLFQRHTGVPVHRYLTRLRLRAAQERLAAGAPDLTALALEFGFASHSHFTDAFRREFGESPSAVRDGRRRTLAN